MKNLAKFFVLMIGASAFAWIALPAEGQIAVRNQGYVPYSEEPINYRTAPVNDPVARLQRRLDRGEVKLSYEPGRGYLRSVLELLDVPISSQSLVFSKTSFQFRKISPQTPRALYFNDDVYVGSVRDGKAIEIISFDPNQGAIFYILAEQKAEKPAFERAELDCTQCHVAAGTRGVPGVLLRSIYPKPTGTQAGGATSFTTGHQSPLSERFGGWYVTGTSKQTHMGNAVVQDPERPEQMDRAAGANVTDLSQKFDIRHYLTGHSDIVAQLVQAHQTAIIVLLSSIAAAQSPEGRWDASITIKGVVVPFRLEIAGQGADLKGTLFNGEQTQTTTSAKLENNSLVLNFDHYLTKISATVKDGKLEGNVRGRFDRERYLSDFPFQATRYVASAAARANAPAIDGLWILPYESPKGEKAWRFIVKQKGAEISAAILRVDGDTGALTGSYRDGKFVVSHFDASRPLVLEVTPNQDGTLSLRLEGAYTTKTDLIAYRPEVASAKGLPEPANFTTHTTVRDPKEPFKFSFPDLDGKLV
jgi:hypothetical protein